MAIREHTRGATAEVAALPEGDAVRAVERAVVFTALAEPVLLAMRLAGPGARLGPALRPL